MFRFSWEITFSAIKRRDIKIFLQAFVFSALLCYEAVGQRVSPIKVNAGNARAYRDSLILRVFGQPSFPYSILPDSIHTNIDTLNYYNSFPYTTLIYPTGNLDSVDRLDIFPSSDRVDFPEPVSAYLFHPHNNNGKLFIYHSGHCAGSPIAEDAVNGTGSEAGLVIPALLAEGYTLLSVPMFNYRQLYQPGLVCGYNNHDSLFTENDYSYPLSLFFNPLIASLNYIDRSTYNSIFMCGLSGGGWVTSVYPALDSSISCSFPIAGSLPLRVREVFSNDVDMEQSFIPVFSNLLDYHELYTLSCLAPARKMLQINNRYDPCCFSGSQAHVFYMDSVSKALQGSGGEFRFYLDETNNVHNISTNALKVMLNFLKGDTASLLTPFQDTVEAGANLSYDLKSNFLVNNRSDTSSLRFSLLKSPGWLGLNSETGILSGSMPNDNIIVKPDTVSFKIEDRFGNFILNNYIVTKRRAQPSFFALTEDKSTVFFVPLFSGSITNVSQLVTGYFTTGNSSLSITEISIINNSVLKLKFNGNVSENDSIAYNGAQATNGISYFNGERVSDFGPLPITFLKQFAVSGMIRFNTDTSKFEYFNGSLWINMN